MEALDKNSLTLVATDGTQCTVDPMAFRKTVYEQQSIEIAVGDRIKWTRSDRKLGRRNRQQFVVTAINGNHAQIKSANGKTDEVDLNQLQHLDYALVSTTYSSQGKTADRVMIAADKTMGKESFYVAVSRAKYDLKIYTEDKSDLLKLARKSKAKEIAIELIGSKPVANQAKTTEQSISVTQLPITNEETTHERTHEPARPTADTEQFSLDDIEQRFLSLERAGHRQTGNNQRHSTSERVSWAVKVEQQPIERTSRQFLNAIAHSAVKEAIASDAALNAIAHSAVKEVIALYIDQTAVESEITQPVATLTEQIAQQPLGLSGAMKQLDAVISNRLQKLDALKTSLEKSRSNRATVALSDYINSSAVESALGVTVSSLVEQFREYRQQLASDKTAPVVKELLNRLESVSNPDEKAKLHPKDLQEVEALAERRSPFSRTNQSTGGKLPERNEAQWAQVRQYLVQKRCLPTQLVDGLASAGKVYADNWGNAIFLHTASQGRVTGATVFDVKSEVLNCQLAPGADNGVGYFQLSAGKGKLSRVVLTDSPIEAVSLAALERGRSENRTLYIDVNKRQDDPKIQSLLDSGVGIEVAFSAEGAGETRARQIVDSFPGVIRSKPAQGKSWNDQLRSISRSKNSKPIETKKPHQQRFDPKQHLLKAIQFDRARYKSACQADLKLAINGLVAGRSLEQLRREIASSSNLVKPWEASGQPSTLATAKTIQYVEQLIEEAQSESAYYQQLYHKYLRDMQRTHGPLPRAELDQRIVSAALKFHSESSVKSMLKYSLAAIVGDDNYIPQILAEVRRQEQSLQEPPQQKNTRTYEPQDLEYENK